MAETETPPARLTLESVLEWIEWGWTFEYMNIEVGRLIAALVVVLLGLIARKIFSHVVINRLKAITEKTRTTKDDLIVQALELPMRMLPVLTGFYFGLKILDAGEAVDSFFNDVFRSFIVFLIFWSIHRTLRPLSATAGKLREMFSEALVDWGAKLAKVVVMFIGLAAILNIWGIELGPLLAGLGIFGAAVALGAQDIFKNLFAGLSVIAEKRFNPGDWVRVEGICEGVVEHIGIRSTMIRQFDKAPIEVPNGQLSDAALINYSRMTHRRIYWMIGVEYRTTIDQLKLVREEIHNYIRNNDAFDIDVTNLVNVDGFGDSSIDIMVYCFTKTTAYADYLQIRDDLAFAIKDIVENKAGTGFAFPSRTVYMEYVNAPPGPGDGQPEAFVPPRE